MALPGATSAQSSPPVSVSLCELLKNPKTYQGKEIQVRGKVNLEFEDFTIYDLKCNNFADIWLMLGGDAATPIMSMWGDTKRTPGKNLFFSGKEYTLVKDASFDDFIKHVTAREKKRPQYRVTATLTGDFFAENPEQDSRMIGDRPGFGHMGCCRLLIIKQVSAVESTQITAAAYNEKWSARREQTAKP
jgi:hypothetical protein